MFIFFLIEGQKEDNIWSMALAYTSDNKSFCLCFIYFHISYKTTQITLIENLYDFFFVK